VENVAALLGRGLGRVLGDLAEIGYDVEWHCIPASAVGASHRRDRLWAVAYSNGDRPQGIGEGSVTCFTNGPRKGSSSGGALAKTTPPDPDSSRVAPSGDDWGMGWGHVFTKYRPWEIASQPFIRRGIDGVPNRLDRLRGLGNAVVPQVVAEIGKAILQAERIAA
jgi:DNA (cytosine-5)-methyltransferase 1